MEEDASNSTTESTILSALSTLTQPQLSHLTHSISSLLRFHCRRLSVLLSSPTLFTLTLNHLHSISLTQKSLLLARHLLSTLSLLTHSLHPTTTNNNAVNLRHLDSTLLLLLLCEVRQHHPQALDTPLSQWLPSLSQYFSTTILSLSTLPISNDAILFQYIDLVAKCHRFVGVMGCGGGGEAAAAVAAVVGLPSVEVSGAARECVICKEEMREGRDVCELPCDHLFHWMCILPWLKKRNTCPCCRYRLPTDDVYGEIDRLWEVIVKVSGNKFIGESK